MPPRGLQDHPPTLALATDHGATGDCALIDKPAYEALAGDPRATDSSPLRQTRRN